MSASRIAVVGLSCRYPDAESPDQLWHNVLAGRRAFRRLPDERMRAEDYYSPDPQAPDRFYSATAAVIEGWEFDRVAYRIAGSTYRSTDLTHWLALDTAARALIDAGFPAGEGLPKDRTGVIIGNTLTGEFSRANNLRLRWPYVRRTVGAALREQGWDDAQLGAFLDQLEARYKQPFPPINEDTLAGGLANTIAGRICNYFDFKGGGFTVDGACSSSLLSAVTACNALTAGQLDAAVVGGVDLSIDPFEVIGFAKTGALATGEMRVYDRNSNGFWPGEGCGMLVLMREEDAVAQGRHRYATIAGWGYSSDGKGGITRPEADGHRLALTRAYAAAGFGLDTVAYLEGHGTGTAVGDATELRAFSEARRAADPTAPAAAISTIKGNIGHTKAAAGVAGLLKAILAVHHQVIPPATGHVDPHAELTGDSPALRVPNGPELWPADQPVRAGVSSMGFGGINAHVVVDQADDQRREHIDADVVELVRSRQDCELLLIDADTVAELRGTVAQLAALAPRLSYAELTDLAVTLHQKLADRPIRAAILAASPAEAAARLAGLLDQLDAGARSALDPAGGIFLGNTAIAPRIGLLFPGQGAGRSADGGALRRRFAAVDRLYRELALPADADQVATAVAQPRIVTGSVAGLRVLAELGIEAVTAAGHSLGELTALHWAGAMDEPTLLAAAAARGRFMADASEGGGTMASIAAAPDDVRPLLAGERVVIAGYNSPTQTVVSGPEAAVERVGKAATARGFSVVRINVSHAFHSELVAPAAVALREYLDGQTFTPLTGRMVSTVTGAELPADTHVPELLQRQVLDPVRFADAVEAMAPELDLLIEVGPGRILRGLAAEIAPSVPAIALETDGNSLAGLLRAVGAAYALGAPVRHDALFADRYARPLALDKTFRFFASPAESAPDGHFGEGMTVAAEPAAASTGDAGANSLELLRRLASERAELPLEAVRADSQPLDELHLSSITLGQIVNQACRELQLPPPAVTSAYATATIAELAEMLDQLADTATTDQQPAAAAGVAPWVRAFTVDLVPEPVPARAAASGQDGEWRLFAPKRHPIAAALLDTLSVAGLGDGVLLCLPRDTDESQVATMLAAARAVVSAKGDVRFVAVGDRLNAAGLAKTLHLEYPAVATTVVQLALPVGDELPDDTLPARIAADVAATDGFIEVHYAADGTRRLPVLRPIALADNASDGLSGDDVLLVTGGGKGITAESALALARSSGAAIGLLGRSDPAQDAELAANLDRMTAAGVRFHYARADVTALDEVKAAVDEIGRELGPVTAVLHGAGRNVPLALANLDESSFKRTLAPKIDGLDAVLTATDPATLRLLVTFGSIIGRGGLRGQADYAVANDWLTELTHRVGRDFPNCRCLALEWSVWAGAGMGERLGVLESLIRDGIAPIPLEDGIDILRRVIADPAAPDAMVIMGRADGLPTLTMPQRELPLRRFLESPQVHYPDVELVVDTELSGGSDLYLPDHLLDGDLLFPAVLGMEAMAQAGAAVTGLAGTPVLTDMEFLRPIVVPVDGSTVIRVAVLVTEPGVVRAVIRSGETAFQADHFRATLRYGQPPVVDTAAPADGPMLPLRADELYGPVLFQGSRFQRLTGYRALAATSCVAEISATASQPWFAGYLPDELVLADPGTRDALMHSIQCCVPDATLLPAGIEALYLADPATAPGVVTLHARERWRRDDTYLYDLDVRDETGRLVERWTGLRLQAVRKQDGAGPWLPTLLGPYLERRTEQVLPASLRVAVTPYGDDDGQWTGRAVAIRRAHTSEAVRWTLGKHAVVHYRPDGKPELNGAHAGTRMSAAHGAGVTFVTAGEVPVGCDVEAVVERPELDWIGLLGPDGWALAQLVSEQGGEPLAMAATRVWTAVECLRKNGRAGREPLTVDEVRDDRWVLFRSGPARIASFPTTLRGVAEPVVFTLLAESEE
ncbi:MAG TPA: type I polyketide synthase [Kutzneria sp.]|nr:type I polyketide synthase [Kutzneria sp.]